MLTPEQLRNLPKPLTDIYSELSELVLRDIARRIAGAASITATAEYQLYRARALGMSTKEITKKIAEINAAAESEIESIIQEAAEKSDEFDRRMLGADKETGTSLSENETLQSLMAAQIQHTRGLCVNFTKTAGFAETNASGQVVYSSLTDFLRKHMDMAHMQVTNGIIDYNSAIRQACNALANSGLRTVYYESGRSDRIEVAVRRALLTSVSQITHSISEQNGKEFGANGWEMSAHAGARPSHAEVQGRQYTQWEYEERIKDLISEPNCRHDVFPIIFGVSQPTYTEEQLANIDPPPFTYEGRTYTSYEAQQQMRKMERVMRKQKDRCIVADAAGDVENYTVASIRLRRQKDIYEDFAKQADSYAEYERTFVAGYNRHLAGKSSYATKVWKQMQSLVGTTTSDGLKITYVSDHFVGRSMERKISTKEIADTLTKPLDRGKIKTDSKGRKSQAYIGANALVNVNPDTGELITAWHTSTKLKKKGSTPKVVEKVRKDKKRRGSACQRQGKFLKQNL